MIKLGNNDITLKVGSTDVSAAYLGSVLVYNPVPPEPKWIATYTGGTTSSAQCDASSAITSGEVTTTGLVSVEIGSCVTTIGNKAFSGCTSLTSVTIPNSVTSIGNYAFNGCSGLTSASIGSGVTSIGTGAFYHCTGLTSVTIPNSVTSIGQNAFSDCSGLTSVQIGSGVTIIGISAFNGCTSLTSVNIPSGVTNINASAFQNCSGLTSVTIPNSVTSIGNYAFYRCSGLTSASIGSGVTSIGTGAFYHCTGLTSVTIPNSVTSIGDFAFRDCNSLTSITCLRTEPPALGGTSVFYITNDCPIYVPAASVDAYKEARRWNTYASRIQAIPEPSPQWVTFNSGDDISGLNVYGVKGVANNLSNTFADNSENIYFEMFRNIVNATIGDYSSPCYTDTYGFNDNVELIFGNIGCSDYYTLPASKTAIGTIQLYIYQ